MTDKKQGKGDMGYSSIVSKVVDSKLQNDKHHTCENSSYIACRNKIVEH